MTGYYFLELGVADEAIDLLSMDALLDADYKLDYHFDLDYSNSDLKHCRH